MPPSDSAFTYGRLGVRLLSLYFIVRGCWILLSNLLGSIPQFDPSYLGHFFYTQVLYPLVGIGLGLVLYLCAPLLAQKLLKE